MVLLPTDDGDWEAAECECKKLKRQRRLLRCSGLTELLRINTFSNYKVTAPTKKAHETCYQYVIEYPEKRKERKNGIALVGPVGTGKTHLISAIANNLLAKQIPTVFVNTPDFIAELRQAMFDESMERKLDAISQAEVVILDDLAKEKTSEWVQNQYYRIINHRYLYSLPTLITSNCSMDELAEKIGDASASRLYAMCQVVEVGGEDWRLKE